MLSKPRPRVIKKKNKILRKLKKILSNFLLVGSKNDAATKVRAYQEKKKSPCSGFQFVAGAPSCQSTDHSTSSRESSIESTDASSTNLHDSRQFCSFQNAAEQRLGFGYRVRIRFRVERICAIVDTTPTRHLSRKLEAQIQRFSIFSPLFLIIRMFVI